jgi:bacterial/archaeal transporter family protein
MKEWFVYTLLALLLWGFWAFLPKIATRHIDPYSAMVYQALGAILVGTVLLIALKFKVEFNVPGFFSAFAIGVLGLSGAFAYIIALSKGPLALVAPLSAMYPVLAILLSFLILHESVTLRQGIGIAFSLVSIYLIST